MNTFDPVVLTLTDDASVRLTRVPFGGLISEARLERLLIETPALAGEDLLVLGNQLAEFDEDRDRLDVLAVDRDGELVLIELKVSDDFRTTDLQAIAYAGAYSQRPTDDLADTLAQWSMRRGRQGYEDGTRAHEAAREEFTEFAGLDGFDDWEPSEKVRIKLIAPGFPRRVLHNVRYLGDVYGMPIEAIEARLYRDEEHHTHLTVNRLLPLPAQEEFDLTRRIQAERVSAENRSRQKRPSALKVLLDEGIVKVGDTLYVLPVALSVKNRHVHDKEGPAFRVVLVSEHGGRRVRWTPTGRDEDARDLVPSAVPWAIDAELCGWEGPEYGSAVAPHFSLTPGGPDLEQELVSRGLW